MKFTAAFYNTIFNMFPAETEFFFSGIYHSEYQIVFNEIDGKLSYNGGNVVYSMCEDKPEDSNIAQISDAVWEERRQRIAPLEEQIQVLLKQISDIREGEHFKTEWKQIDGLHEQVKQLGKQVYAIRSEAYPLRKKVTLAVVDLGDNRVLILS